MELSSHFVPLLVLLFGSINVILLKWADRTTSMSSDGTIRVFEHPYTQAIIVFFAEFVYCLSFYKATYFYLSRRTDGLIDRNPITAGDREFSYFIFIIPSICNLISTYLSFMGLFWCYASSYQFLKGTSLIFIGVFSVSYLDQKLTLRHGIAFLLLTLASIFICISDVNNNIPENNNSIKYDSNAILTGNLLVIIAQIFRALKIVYEEKHLKLLNINPLQFVGWQGFFAFAASLILLIPLNFMKGNYPFVDNSRNVLEDSYDAIIQILNNPLLLFIHAILIMFAGIESLATAFILKNSSASSAVIINCISALFVWFYALLLYWEYLYYLQLISLFTLICGICVYKNVLSNESCRLFIGRIMNRRFFGNDREDGIEEVINQPADAVIN